jgi:hypothetical protein
MCTACNAAHTLNEMMGRLSLARSAASNPEIAEWTARLSAWSLGLLDGFVS